MRPRYVKTTRKDIEKSKDRQTGTGKRCDGTTNPKGIRKLDNTRKGIRNTIPRNPDNPLQAIRDLVQNRTQSQWPSCLTVPT